MMNVSGGANGLVEVAEWPPVVDRRLNGGALGNRLRI